MGFIRKFFDGFGKKKSKSNRIETPRIKDDKEKIIPKKPKTKKKEEFVRTEKLSYGELKQNRKGNINRKKRKVAKYTERGQIGKINKISKRNNAINRKKKNLEMNFNKNLDENERKHRDRVREVRRKARGLKPYKR